MSTAALERQTLRAAPTVGPALALAGLATLLLTRVLPAISSKPLHEDEAVAGLIAARPLGEVLQTVVLDRGGAPLHFVLAHSALALDTSPDALRWLSVVFAIATIPVCYDLARRLAGRSAGVLAAALAATSQLLTIYATFGRMYSLFAFASALAADLFLRAVQRPTRNTALAAAATALLPVAVHPFGAFLFVAELLVAAWLWRRQTLRAALPVFGLLLPALPLLFANVRLFDRYAAEGRRELDLTTFARALGGAAGGWGATLVVFGLLAFVGLLVNRAFAALTTLTVAIPVLTLGLATASDRIGPRHLMFALPLWIALVAAGAVRAVRPLPPATRIALLGAVALTGALAPSAVADPRTHDRAVAAPAAELRARVSNGDVIYPYSPVFLAALPDSAKARGLPREPVALARATQRLHNVRAVFVSLPTRDSWLILERRGPFRDGRALLNALVRLLGEAPPTPYARQLRGAVCEALGCQPVATSTEGTSPHRSSSR